MNLTTDKQERKETPITRGVLDYFPLAIAAVSNVSFVGNKQHNGDAPMYWARGKSNDHADCLARHLIERGTIDDDGLRHSAKLAWRALALLQEEMEKPEEAPLKTLVQEAQKDGKYQASRGYASCSIGKVIYVSGPMRGIKDFNFPAFDATRDLFRSQGHEVISPADMDRAAAKTDHVSIEEAPEIYVKRDVDALIRVKQSGRGAIYMMAGWTDSRGAQAEYRIAEWLGLEIMYQE